MQADILFIAHALNGLLMIAMPIGLAIYLTRRFKMGWRLWFIGATGFIISQIFHIPFLNLLTTFLKTVKLPGFIVDHPLITNAILLGLLAGIFEEVTRYAILKIWARDARSWRTGILLGAGHGGAEAIILGGMVFYSFIQLVAYRGMDLTNVVPANQLALAQQQVSTYWSATWYDSLLGAVERFFTIPVQICFSVMVMQAFTRKHTYWLGLAILWHTVIDGFTVYFNGILKSLSWGVYAVEGLIAIFSVISIVFLFALRQPEPVEPELPLPPLERREFLPVEVKETPENLDDSRFN